MSQSPKTAPAAPGVVAEAPQPLPLAGSKAGSFHRAEAWVVVAVIGAVDWMWARQTGLSIVAWTRFDLTFGLLVIIGSVYGYSGRDLRLADAGNYAAMWVAFSTCGAILTYLAATPALPLRDAEFARIDASLGFDWMAWYGVLHAHPRLHLASLFVYNAMLPEIVLSVVYFAHVRRSDRNAELLWIAMVSLIITTAVSAIVPALGAAAYFHAFQPDYLSTLQVLRDGSVKVFSMNEPRGIIQMPSYHTVIAILIVYVHRPPMRTFKLATAINIAMLLTVAPVGGHYFVDIIGGAIVAAISIWFVRAAIVTEAPHPEPAVQL
ncbi:MAG TPA: phosphatase PAP2 family protein [Candidatus Binataceae bacterium]|nr:phosphatase PAP2 family protein [Candidatus Binataceae bacterium]